MSDLNEQRREITRLRRAATRKISRIKQTYGAEVSGTEFDPRRETKAHTQYTAKQLAAYKNRLAEFVSRSTQFVPDASRQPIPRAEFQEYKRREAKYRDTAGAVYERIKNVELPSGETIQGRLAAMRPLHKSMHNTAVNAIFDPLTRESGDITSRAALNKLAKALQRDSSPANIRRKVRDARDQLAAMLDTINEPALYAATEKLSNDQFIALWNHTAFAGAVALSYESSKKLLSPKEESWGHEMLRQQMSDAMELVTWASRIKA